MYETYLEKVIEKSEESLEKGLFPAGAVVVCNDEVISSSISTSGQDFHHAEIKAIDQALRKLDSLEECVLFSSMQPCLMCMSAAYWSGIRKVVFAINKEKLSVDYYEGSLDYDKIASKFNEKVDLVHVESKQSEALKIVKKY